MKLLKHISTGIFLLASLSSWAITQQGYVRTITRPNHPSERLEGVLIRIRGGHNAIMTEQSGDFAIVMQELQNGDPFVLSAVMKSGYQLSEQDIIGRQQASSDHVPLEVTMVSLSVLQQEKEAIAEKARSGVQRYYMEQLAAIENELSQHRLNQEQYEQRINELDERLMQSEQQIQEMADRYARTDYAVLDELAGSIQQAVEQGDLDEAERLIRSKGSFLERQQRIVNMQRDLAAQTRDLKQDYYHFYSIALGRFQPDSAAYYLKMRADLDSTDVAAQLDYVAFLNGRERNRQEAWLYTQRAYRHVQQKEGPHSMLMLRVLNEQGSYYGRSRRFNEAYAAYTHAVALCDELYGRDHHFTATRLSNLASVCSSLGKTKEAKRHYAEALRIVRLPDQSYPISEANILNGLGTLAFMEKDYQSAYSYYLQAVTLLETVSPYDNMLPKLMANLGAICTYLDDYEQAHLYDQKAYELSRKIYGEQHPYTLSLQSILEPPATTTSTEEH